MFTCDPYLVEGGNLILGFTWLGHNVVVINLYGICYLNSWNLYILIGYWSVIMHEVGHCYGCAGDTWKEHLDVMDYYWGLFPPYHRQFDSDHRGIIGPNRGLHSD